MNSAVIHPGDNVTIRLTLDAEDLCNNNNEPQKTINQQSCRTIEEGLRPNLEKQEDLKKANMTIPARKPPFVTRRTSSLLGLNIEGLLIVPELEWRLRRNSYGGPEAAQDGKKETEVDPSDGMLTTSLCTTEL
ncbi:hypothetical protein OS493_008492 [Desmophyllum pertusum]|uniref:Uncharacterized protein n=1 Tax=Desmophyllum pertusum TaxID=174260 RepID=A0A9X0D673_9CNID|nr:hypothetical protein OS493_008492 [Desmophyllum pertusum]